MLVRIVLIGLVVTSHLCGPVPACSQPAVVSLWADSIMSACSVYPDPPPNITFDLYIYVEPDTRGMYGVEFSLVNHSAATVLTPPGEPVWNPAADIVVADGSFFGDGISIEFNTCHHELVWIAMFSFTSSEVVSSAITLNVATTGDPPEVQEHINIAICDEAHTRIEAFAYNFFGINQSCLLPEGAEESSWGAIKQLYR